jgi:hypothetical protein
MPPDLASSPLSCTQCGGELHPDEGQIFLTCPFCGSAVYLDKSQVVFHWSLAPTLTAAQAQESLARWMAGNQTVKDLDTKAQVAGQVFQYFPMWYLKRRAADREVVSLIPAAATSVTELSTLPLTAGDLRRYDDALLAQSAEPTVPLPAARAWLEGQSGPGEVLESALVHIPIYTFKYIYKNQPFTAIVEAASGRVLANLYPAKAEAPYLLAAIVTAAVFLCLATWPLIGSSVSSSGNGLLYGLLACAGASVILVPALLALAAYIAAKV